MNNSANLIRRGKIDTRFYKDSLCLIPYVVFSFLALLSTVHCVFSAFNFILCILYILFYKKDKTIPFLIYVTYFASIFKILEITEISLYTLLLFVFVIKEVHQRKFKIKFLISLVILATFVISIDLVKGPVNISRCIKFFEFFFYIYIVIDTYFDSESQLECSSMLKAVIFGVIISSTFRFLDSNIFNISKFVGEKYSLYEESVFTRFSGLLGDPNYFAVNVFVAIVSTLFLGCKKKIPYVCMLLILLTLVGLAVLTGSKSAILMLVLPFVLLLYVNVKLKLGKLNIALLIGTAVCLIIIISLKSDYFSYILLRFTSSELSIDLLTTGRTAIWRDYSAYFNSNLLNLVFGSGISALPLNGYAAHNTYFDILYYLGIIPGIVYSYLIVRYFFYKRIDIKRSILNFSGIIVVLTMYSFLSSLFDIDLGTNIIVGIILFNTCLDNAENNIKKSNVVILRENDNFEVKNTNTSF